MVDPNNNKVPTSASGAGTGKATPQLLLDSLDPVLMQKHQQESPMNSMQARANTMEAQSQPVDLKRPRHAPQLVGLTTLSYAPDQLEHKPSHQPSSNILKTSDFMSHFYKDKPKSKRVQNLRRHASQLADSSDLIQVQIELPEEYLLEQINLQVKPPHQQSDTQLIQSNRLLPQLQNNPSTDDTNKVLKSAESSQKLLGQGSQQQSKQDSNPQLLQGSKVHDSKQMSSFSQNFALIAILDKPGGTQLPIKSCFSETVTRTGLIEYNVVAITKRLTLVFAKNPELRHLQQQHKPSQKKRMNDAAPISLDDVEIKISSQADVAYQQQMEALQLEDKLMEMLQRGEQIQNGSEGGLIGIDLNMINRQNNFSGDCDDYADDDDIRILDSLPQTISARRGGTNESREGEGDQKSQKVQDREFIKLLQSIQILGFSTQAIPAITNLTYFMNQKLFLLTKSYVEQAYKVDFLIGQLLVTTKRATQAAEVYRKMQQRLLKFATGKGNQASAFVECAILELLICDSLSPEHQMPEKMQSLTRLHCFIVGQQPPDLNQRFQPGTKLNEIDSYTSMLAILQDSLRFVLVCLSHQQEIVRMSALKLVKHILETQGCSLDFGLVFILKGMLCTFPTEKPAEYPKNQFQMAKLMKVDMQITEYLYNVQTGDSMDEDQDQEEEDLDEEFDQIVRPAKSKKANHTEYTSKDEPSSGFRRALINTYQNVLDTFISVLSSVSSHILHAIFYEVIEPTLLANSSPLEVRVFTCKIADKIITICQGDLLISNQLLDCLLQQTSDGKNFLPESGEQSCQQQIKNLWHSVRQKVFPNYSTKGFRSLVDWLVTRLTDIKVREPTKEALEEKKLAAAAQSTQQQPPSLNQPNEDSSLEEQVRQLSEIISIVSLGRQKGEEDANQLIRLPTCDKYGGGTSSELYLVLTPMIYWLEYSIDKKDRLSLFQQIYQTIKDVLQGLPPGQLQTDLDMPSIMFPSLQRTNDFLVGNSPSLAMLKFLDIVLGDMQRFYTQTGKTAQNSLHPSQRRPQPPQDMQFFFLDMLQNLATYLSYSLYEEVFLVFDKLLSLCADLISDHALKKCIVALVDKYTMKSKQHKATLGNFLKCLLDVNICKKTQSPKQAPRTNQTQIDLESGLSDGNDMSMIIRGNYFEVMADFCFFQNSDDNINYQHEFMQLDFRSQQDMRDLFVDKLQFFIDSIALMNENHINLFTNLITHPNFKQVLLGLLRNGDTNVRLKSHEIMEVLTAFFVQFCPSKTVYEFASNAARANATDPLGLADPSKGLGSHGHHHHQQNEMMDAEFISHERLYISQIVIQIARASLEKKNDCYLQFNALILLDFLFQNLLPVPTFQNEQLKGKRLKQEQQIQQQKEKEKAAAAGIELKGQDSNTTGGVAALGGTNAERTGATGDEMTMDVEVLSISEHTPELDVLDSQYLRMRMRLVFSLWPHVLNALNSPWSNIRSICYGLICSMLKIDINDYPKGNSGPPADSHLSFDSKASATNNVNMNDPTSPYNKESPPNQQLLRELILPMLYSLLSSKESESKAGGLNILGSFCGLSYDFTGVTIHKNVAFFQRNSQFVSLPIWKLVYQLQDDWDITIKEASVVLVQLCAPRNAILYFQAQKEKKEKTRLKTLSQMPRASEIYQGTKMSGPPQIYQEGVVKSTQAMRACSLFPKEQDVRNILDQSVCSASNEAETHFALISFENYMMDRGVSFTPELPQLNQIESYNTVLTEKVNTFNPTYEDKRLTRGHQPMSRRRQIEIELNMTRPSNRNGADNEAHDPNFFVDAYSDDQIQEIISIFRNDFKPPKNLWIEKQPNSIGGGSGSQANQNSAAANQHAQSPDFFQDIYSDAIEQFNQHQTLMQQKQQDELQQQVSSGSSLNTSVSSVGSASSVGSTGAGVEIATVKASDSERQDSSCSNTPSPTPPDLQPQQQQLQQQNKMTIVEKRGSTDLGKNSIGTPESPVIDTSSNNLVVPIGPVGPTSPVLVSQCQNQHNLGISAQQKAANAEMKMKLLAKLDEFDTFGHPNQPQHIQPSYVLPPKPSLQMEQLDFQGVAIAQKKYKKPQFDKKDSTSQQLQHLGVVPQNGSTQPSSHSLLPPNSFPIHAPGVPSQGLTHLQRNLPPPNLTDNDYFKETDQHVVHLKNHTQRAEPKKDKLHTTQGSNSTPDFSMILQNQKTPKTACAKPNHNQISINSGNGGNFSQNSNMHQPHNNNIGPHQAEIQTTAAAGSASGFGHQSSRHHHGGQGSSDEQRISRKMAQTYLSGLSQGYISNLDNLKLLNNCINSSSQPNPVPHHSVVEGGIITNTTDASLSKGHGGSGKTKAKSTSIACNTTVGAKLSTRTNTTLLEGQLLVGAPSSSNMFGSTQHMSQTTKSQKKNTLNSSPQIHQKGTRKSSNKFKSVKNINKSSHDAGNYNKLLRDTTGINSTHHANQSSNGLADLNYFIKTIEKDLSEKLKNRQELNSMPNTPSNMIKKVGDQMKALGVDPKLWKQVEMNELRKQHQQQTRGPPPQVKLLALNQIVKNDDSNCTPSNSGLNNGSKMHKTSSPHRQGGVSGSGGPRSSESEGCIGLPTGEGQTSKSARQHDKKGVLSLGGIESSGTLGKNLVPGAGRESHHVVKTHRNTHQDHGSARGLSNHSQGNHSQHQGSGLDKSLLSDKFAGKQHPVTTKAKDVSAFQFKKGSHQVVGANGLGGSGHGGKQNQKGFSALASKTQQLKRDQQSGGLVMTLAGTVQQHNTKLNSSVGAIGGGAATDKHGLNMKKSQKGSHGAHAVPMTTASASAGFMTAKNNGIKSNAMSGTTELVAKCVISELMNNNNIGGGSGSAGGGLGGGRGEQLCANVTGGGPVNVEPVTVRQPLTQRNNMHHQQQMEQGDYLRQPQSPESASAGAIGGKPPLRKKSGQSVKNGSMMMVAKPPGLFLQQPSYF